MSALAGQKDFVSRVLAHKPGSHPPQALVLSTFSSLGQFPSSLWTCPYWLNCLPVMGLPDSCSSI